MGVEVHHCGLVFVAVIEVAELTGDRFEIHMTEAGARRHGFAGRVAQGLLVLALIDGLKAQSPARIEALVALGWEWNFRRPVLLGDSIRAVFTVQDKRPTARLDRGLLTLGAEV